MVSMADKGREEKTQMPSEEEPFGVRAYKNSVRMQTAGLALGTCINELESRKAELEKASADYALLKSVLNYALGEAGLGPGDIDRLIGMAKAGGSEKEKMASYLGTIMDERTY